MFGIFISVLFAGLNGYFAFRAFQRKDWVWFAISSAIALFCASSLLPLIR